ncbi:MAG: hypothetical protein VX589_20280 [Myxococcota bacterium]|nr:hypothetical protein [Myxococcota bacterium]
MTSLHAVWGRGLRATPFRNQAFHSLGLLLLCVSMPAAATPLEARLVGSGHFVDPGNVSQPHDAVIKNVSERTVVLLSINQQPLGPPNFKTIQFMKGPRADWRRWRNVLAPGQSTRIFAGRGRAGPGQYDVRVKVNYAMVSDAFWAHHVKEVVSGPPKNVGKQIRYDHGLPANGPVWVTFAAAEISSDEWQSSTWTFPIRVTPHPQIAALAPHTTIKRFAADLPGIGLLVKTDTGTFTVTGTGLNRLGQGTFEGFARLGRMLSKRREVRIKALSTPRDLPANFIVQTVVNTPMMTSRIRRFSAVENWHVFTLEEAHVAQFITYVRRLNLMVLFDDHDGFILATGPEQLPISGHRLPTPSSGVTD